MRPRHHLLLATLAALTSLASPAFAQNQEDPEPEVSTPTPPRLYERMLAVSVTGGWDTPFGVAGGAIEFAPIPEINIYAGGGVSRSGGRFTFGVNVRAPIRNTAMGLEVGLSGGPLDWPGHAPEATRIHRYWELALFMHSGVNIEHRWEEGIFGRLSAGAEALIAGDITECRGPDGNACAAPPDTLITPIYAWASLTVGWAFEL